MLNPDYRDILSAFNAERVEYLLVGAYALAAHGAPRATRDIDLWIRPTPENARRVWQALARFGAPLERIHEADLTTPGMVVQIGNEPRRIDLITEIDGVTFEEAWRAHIEVVVDGLGIPVISRDDYLKNKRATGRLKDQADIEALGDTSKY